MLNKETEPRQATELLCTDMLVPNNHLLRKIDAAVDFTHIYDLVEDLYCEDNDRPSCDPVVPGLYNVPAAAAFCDDQLCIPVSLHGERYRVRVPQGAGRSGSFDRLKLPGSGKLFCAYS